MESMDRKGQSNGRLWRWRLQTDDMLRSWLREHSLLAKIKAISENGTDYFVLGFRISLSFIKTKQIFFLKRCTNISEKNLVYIKDELILKFFYFIYGLTRS